MRKQRNGIFRMLGWLLLLLVAATGQQSYAQATPTEDSFTLVALPDTQNYSQKYPQVLRAQAQWIVDHANDMNIKMVLHEGDVVNRGAKDPAQWLNAKAALSLIDEAGIPMFIAMGNHDYDDLSATRASTMFNWYLGSERFTGRSWYGGAFEPGKSDNMYGLVTAGGRQYLVMALEFGPRQAVVDWANSVIADHSESDVIIVTHNYLYNDNSHHKTLSEKGRYGIGEDALTGSQLWTSLVSRHKNIVLVLSGHVLGDGLGQRIDFGVSGNLIHQVLANYQMLPEGGSGYLRLMRFRPAAGIIEVKTYSPYLDRYLTDPENEFTLPYNPSDAKWTEKEMAALATVEGGGATSTATEPITAPPVDAEVWAGVGGTLSGKLAEGTKTDILMHNAKLSLMIAATYDDNQLPGATLGKPVDMAAAGLTDGLDWVNPYLSLKQPVWDKSGLIATLQNKSIRVVSSTEKEAVVQTQGIYTEISGISLSTTYTLRPNQEWVKAVTTISNQTNEDVTLWVGDTMDNDDGKQHSLVPGVGDLGPGSPRRIYSPTEPWVGQYGDAPQVFAMAYDVEGLIAMAANVTVMTQKKVTIPGGGQLAFERFLIVASSAGYNDKMKVVTDVIERIKAEAQ